ncbi:MAG: hypothetical protein U0Q16_02200 [Bryobacteraceae bacterium]
MSAPTWLTSALYSAEPTARDLLDLWRDSTGATARKMAADTAEFSRKMLDALVNGNGIYSELYHYWHGGLEMSRRAIFITELLASDQLTAAEKDKLRASAVFYANLLFDNDFVPMFNGHGLNMGTQNMPVQQIGYRDLYALMMRNHPMMAGRGGGGGEQCANAAEDPDQRVGRAAQVAALCGGGDGTGAERSAADEGGRRRGLVPGRASAGAVR